MIGLLVVFPMCGLFFAIMLSHGIPGLVVYYIPFFIAAGLGTGGAPQRQSTKNRRPSILRVQRVARMGVSGTLANILPRAFQRLFFRDQSALCLGSMLAKLANLAEMRCSSPGCLNGFAPSSSLSPPFGLCSRFSGGSRQQRAGEREEARGHRGPGCGEDPLVGPGELLRRHHPAGAGRCTHARIELFSARTR